MLDALNQKREPAGKKRSLSPYRIWLVVLTLLQPGTVLAEPSVLPFPVDLEARTLGSRPYDVEIQKDQINITMSYDGVASFDVASKPGEMIFVDKAVGTGGEAFRYAFIVQPEGDLGQLAQERAEARQPRVEPRTYRLQVFCLNPFDEDPGNLPPFGTCVARPINGDKKLDAVDRLGDNSGIVETREFLEKVTGLTLTITRYEESRPLFVLGSGLREKCCIAKELLTICACRVLSSGDFCATRCH